MLDRFKSELVDPGALVLLAIDIFGKHYKYLILIGLGIYIPVELVLRLMASRVNLIELIQTGDISAVFGAIAASGIIALAILPLETAALTYFAGKKVNGGEAAPEGVMDATFGNWYKLFVTSFIYFSIGIFSMILITSVILGGIAESMAFGLIIIIPAILFGEMAKFCQSLVVAGNVTGLMAIRKSFTIIKRRLQRTVILWLLIWFTEMLFKQLAGSFISVISGFFGQILAPDSMALQILVILLAALANTACMLFGLVRALYFFNLYYIYTEAP